MNDLMREEEDMRRKLEETELAAKSELDMLRDAKETAERRANQGWYCNCF